MNGILNIPDSLISVNFQYMEWGDRIGKSVPIWSLKLSTLGPGQKLDWYPHRYTQVHILHFTNILRFCMCLSGEHVGALPEECRRTEGRQLTNSHIQMICSPCSQAESSTDWMELSEPWWREESLSCRESLRLPAHVMMLEPKGIQSGLILTKRLGAVWMWCFLSVRPLGHIPA